MTTLHEGNSTLRHVSMQLAQTTMNLAIIGLFALLVLASFHGYAHGGSVRTLGVLAANSLFLVLYLARRPAKIETDSLPLWLLAFAGTAAPLLMRPAPRGVFAPGTVVQVAGLALLIVALLSLRRSFAVVPANRGIRDGGLYRVVRHPVYLAELTIMLGIVLANPSARNGVIWGCECLVQFARALAEERLLSADPLYVTYCKQVRYRLIPGIL